MWGPYINSNGDNQSTNRNVCTTHSLLDLSLVGLDLVLQFVDDVLESLLVLAVLVSLEGQLFESAVCLAHVLLGLSVAALLVVQLCLQLADLWRMVGKGLTMHTIRF